MKQSFPIIPAGPAPMWFCLGFAVFMLAMAGLMLFLGLSTRAGRVEVSRDGVQIAGGMYGRTVPIGSLDLSRAELVNLREKRDYQMTMRTNGAGLPGYIAGWVRLRNGEKALVQVTDTSRVLYLPTREGFVLLLSLDQGQQVIDALRAVGAR